jgi:mRNA interferase MazF
VTALPARGEVWWCELPEVGRRPVVVLSRDAAIPRLRRTLIGPCTTVVRGLASEVVLEPDIDPIPATPRSTSTRSRACRSACSYSASGA